MPPEIPANTAHVISRKLTSLNDWALVGQSLCYLYLLFIYTVVFLSQSYFNARIDQKGILMRIVHQVET